MHRRLIVPACACAVLLIGPAALTPSNGSIMVRIVVGPNVLASGDGNIPHVESIVAVNPTNPRNLIGAAIAGTQSSGGFSCRGYTSFDGGSTWTYVDFPGQAEHGGVDPQVAFGPTGTVYVTTLSTPPGMEVHRSVDGGRTWQTVANLKRGYDHEQLVIDHTGGKFNGRIYIAAVHGPFGPPQRHRIAVFHSDDGLTFSGPVDAAGRDSTGLNVTTNILVLSDGTLVVPYAQWDVDADTMRHAVSNPQLVVTSADGGVTFDTPVKVVDIFFGPVPDSAHQTVRDKFDLFTFPAFAADVYGTKFRDRIYMVWRDRRNHRSQLMLTYSSDQGRTWSPPTLVVPTLSKDEAQFQPAITVNRSGVVGILWFGSPASRAIDQYDVYFTASLDGGKTFLAPALVSSEASRPISAGNVLPRKNFETTSDDAIHINTISATSRWPQGGDYIGLASDARGVFHPFWPDSRSGTFQLWTAQVRLDTPTPEGLRRDTHLVAASLNRQVVLDFDADARYSATAQRATIPIRLRNVSPDTLYGPFTVDVVDVGSARLVNEESTGGQHTIDYSTSLRDWPALEPGAVTESRNWILAFPATNTARLDIKASVRGFRKTRNSAARPP